MSLFDDLSAGVKSFVDSAEHKAVELASASGNATLQDLTGRAITNAHRAANDASYAASEHPLAVVQVVAGGVLIATGAGSAAGASLIAKGALTLGTDVATKELLDDAMKPTPETVEVTQIHVAAATLQRKQLTPTERDAVIKHVGQAVKVEEGKLAIAPQPHGFFAELEAAVLELVHVLRGGK